MDALVAAGGMLTPQDPLFTLANGKTKAHIDVAGKPMAQWVLDALSEAQEIENVVIVGQTPDSGFTCAKPLSFVPDQHGMIDNIRAGTREIMSRNPQAEYVLIATGDIPAVTPEIIDWQVNNTKNERADIYYHVIDRETMEARFPNSKRSYVKLKDMEVCGGDMNIASVEMVLAKEGPWDKLAAARKSALRQAALVGFDTLLYMLLRRLDLQGGVAQISKRLGITGQGVLCPYAEVGMDIDKPFQLEILRAELQQRLSL